MYVRTYVCMYVGYVHAYTCKAAFAPEDVSANGSTHQMQHVANTAGTMAGRGVVVLVCLVLKARPSYPLPCHSLEL